MKIINICYTVKTHKIKTKIGPSQYYRPLPTYTDMYIMLPQVQLNKYINKI